MGGLKILPLNKKCDHSSLQMNSISQRKFNRHEWLNKKESIRLLDVCRMGRQVGWVEDYAWFKKCDHKLKNDFRKST